MHQRILSRAPVVATRLAASRLPAALVRSSAVPSSLAVAPLRFLQLGVARRADAAAAPAGQTHGSHSAKEAAASTDEVKASKRPVPEVVEDLHVQADSGAGAEPVRPTSPPGTIHVTIGGEQSPAAMAALAKADGAHTPYGIGARPSVERPDKDWTLMHPLWKGEYVNQVTYTHMPPETFTDKLALNTIRLIRFNFDWMSGYSFGKLTESKALTRIVFLETVAGVPGSVAATLRHLASLRRMKRDGGWIATLMAEAENERMHLLTFLHVRQPGPFMKGMVFLTQGLFFNFFWVSYLISPRFCHKLVGYLEEEAVVTYTKILKEIDGGELKSWATRDAPEIAKKYWKLPDDATLADVVAHVRADEAHHRDVNHTLGCLPAGALNPFRDGRA